jgi:hypothetical protein
MMKRFAQNKKWWIALVIPSVLLVLSFNQSTETPEEPKYKTEYVIVLVIDGPRITETFGDSTHKYIPNLANVLAPQGVLVPKFRNNGPTYTNAGHTAICTGVYQKINNSGLELPKNPSVFQYFLQQKGLDSTQAYVIASKGKLNILANTKNKEWKGKNCPSQFCGTDGRGIGYTNDAYTWRDAQSIFSTYHPKLTLINVLECDVRGHQHQWKEYLEALKRTDNIALSLWNFIQNDPVYKDKTTLFITNDHGRHPDGHKDGFVSHGDKCEGCRSIYLVALGPDFKSNVTLDIAYEQIDISATIAELLGFDFPVSNGRVMRQLFVNDPQKGY